jgi:CheY-like chemotaxis protein
VCNNRGVSISRVLIVDDQVRRRELLRILLENEGCQVSEAGDAAEAVSVARATRPDLVLVDVELPPLDGYAAVRQLNADDQSPHPPIIALAEGSEDMRQLRDAGFSGLLAKPVVCRSLRGRLDQLVQVSSS